MTGKNQDVDAKATKKEPIAVVGSEQEVAEANLADEADSADKTEAAGEGGETPSSDDNVDE